MNIPTEFRGKVYCYWNTKYDHLAVAQYDNLSDEYVLLGQTTEELHIQFADPRAAMVESLEAHIEKERAESAHRIAILMDRKQQLLAIEVDA